MKRVVLFCLFAVGAMACRPAPDEEIVIDLSARGAEISPTMYGIFFEEINHAGDGGLLAEMVENGSFEELEMPEGYHAEGDRLVSPVKHHHTSGVDVQGTYRWTTDPVPGWTLEGNGEMSLTKEDPFYETAPTSLKVDVDGEASLCNDGYWGMNVVKGSQYTLRTVYKIGEGFDGKIAAMLVSDDGTVLSETEIPVGKSDKWTFFQECWNNILTSFKPDLSCDKASLVLKIQGQGTLWLDYVSLLPHDIYTCKTGEILPLRKDVAKMLEDLHPAFIRWPGGCVVEGISLENRFEWKKTLGDPAERPGQYSTWGYRCSYGFGYHEMLSFCESIGADAMFVCNVGLGCQARCGDVCSDEEVEYYIDDCLDAIEYALGPADSEWGAERAITGHVEPYPLKYVEIGNENSGPEYDKHYNRFHEAIKAKYPDLTLICNYGIGGIGGIKETDMIDPHWYVNPSYFFSNTHIFDNVERGRYTAYVGEYAANSGVGSGNMRAALSEAAFIGGMERNSDLVKMASYAPLFENSNDRVWPVNLIWINSSQVIGRSSYYVQKMASENRPDYNVPSSITEGSVFNLGYEGGKVGLGTYHTSTQFRNVRVTTPDGQVQELDPADIVDCRGDWSLEDGILTQKAMDLTSRCMFDGFKGEEYVMDLDFRRLEGPEGLLIYFGLEGGNGWCCNVGGWGDTITAMQMVSGGEVDNNRCAESNCRLIHTGEWQIARLEVRKEVSRLWIDGELILEHKPMSLPVTFYATGYDAEAHELIVKVVNSSASACTTTFSLDGARSVARKGTVIELAASHDTDENSFDEPRLIFPVRRQCRGLGERFEYAFPPYSYTVLRIPAVL